MVDSGGLENRCTCEGTGGSNPSASAQKRAVVGHDGSFFWSIVPVRTSKPMVGSRAAFWRVVAENESLARRQTMAVAAVWLSVCRVVAFIEMCSGAAKSENQKSRLVWLASMAAIVLVASIGIGACVEAGQLRRMGMSWMAVSNGGIGVLLWAIRWRSRWNQRQSASMSRDPFRVTSTW